MPEIEVKSPAGFPSISPFSQSRGRAVDEGLHLRCYIPVACENVTPLEAFCSRLC